MADTVARRGAALRRRSRRNISSVPYLRGLDGMRALAVIAVMVYHANSAWLPGGFIGVEVFFVISGYLITLLLIGEHERSGKIRLGQFYLRRARRLLPALFMMLTLVIVYTALFKRAELGRLRGDVLAGLGYVSNWFQIWVGQGYTAEGQFAPLRHLWSLAVEEQFYLVWPLVMIGLIRAGKGRLPSYSRWLLLAAVVISVAVGLLFDPGRAVDPATTPNAYWDVGGHAIAKTDTLYLSTITRATGLLFGGALAMLWRPVAVMRGPLRNKGAALDVLGLVGIASLLVLAWRLHIVSESRPDPSLFRGGFLAVDLAAVLMIAAVSHRRSFTGRILGMPLLLWIGTRSYGMYLLHWPIFQVMRGVAGNPLDVRQFAVAMAATAAVTELSYRLFEMPIRRRRIRPIIVRLGRRAGPIGRRAIGFGFAGSVVLVGFASASMVTAELEPTDIERSLQRGESAVVDLGAQVTAMPVVPTTGVPVDPTLPIVAAATTESVVETTEPVVETTEPVVETTEPVVETTESAVATTESVVATTEPAVETTEETVETTEPAVEPSEPAVETTEETVETTEPAVDTTGSVVTTTELETTVAADQRTYLIIGPLQAVEDDPDSTTAPDTTESPPTTESTPTTEEPTTTRPSTTTSTSTTTTSTTSTTTSTTEPTTTTVTATAPPTTRPTTTLPRPTTTVRPPVVVAIGDSVMLGAAENLAARGVTVDAAVSRQMIDYLPTVQQLSAQHRLGDVVVVHLGTNGPFSEATMTAFFDALRDVPRVLVLTVHAERGWVAANNELIASLPSRYPNVSLIDWNGAVGGCPGDCLYDDGIHLPPDGRRYYAQLIFDQIGL